MAGPNLDLPLACRCGRVRGVAAGVAPTLGFRFVCYCRDCRAFAHALGRPDVLDAAGGTDIFQMPMGRMRLTAGRDAVRCLSVSGRVLRWYAACCGTPIGNTAGPRFPMVGLIAAFADAGRRDEAIGPQLCRLFEASATGPLPRDAPPPPTLALRLRRTTAVLGWWWHGLGRPSPFFDASTGAPIAEPRPLAEVILI